MTPERQEQAPSEQARKAAEAWAQTEYEQYQHYVSSGCCVRIARLLDSVAAEARREERESCARVAEEHAEHVDFNAYTATEGIEPKEQSHVEPPYICNVAQAIRARGQS